MRRILSIVLVAFVAAACGDARPAGTPALSTGSFPATIQASSGPVTVPARPTRIVSLSPTSTEILFAIGAGTQVIAVDDQSNYPASAPKTTLSGFEPNIEAIASYRPDLVVFSTGFFSQNFFVGARWFTDDDEIAGLARQGFVDLFTAVRPLTDRLVLLRDIPMARQDPAVCLTTGHPDLGACMFTPDPRSALMADMSVQAARQTGTPVVDPTKWLCWDGSCPVIIGSTISYRDTNHMSAAYSARLADPLARALQLDRP